MLIVLITLTLFIGIIYYRLRIQEERLRVLMAFVAGLFERSAKHSQIINEKNEDTKLKLFKDYAGYKDTIHSIASYFEEDYWSTPFRKFLLSKWNLFVDNRLANGGFDQIYKDFFIHLSKEVIEEESSLFSETEKKKLELLITKNEKINAELRKELKSSN